MGSHQEGSLVTMRRLIWILVMVIFTGSFMIWIMTPTNTYRKKWLPMLRNKTNKSTYFGTQGSPLLLYMFPILLAACLGCVYLHLGKKKNYIYDNTINDSDGSSSNNKKEGNEKSIWKKPMITRGPLGIVSGIEMMFFTMFISLLVWSLSIYLTNSFANINKASAEEDGEQVWESKMETSALRLGIVGNICLALLFFPVARGSSLLPLFGLTSESSIKYHIWIGHLLMSFYTAHGLLYITLWIATNDIDQMLEWRRSGISNVAGEIALLAGLILWSTTIPQIRRKMFNLFFYTHHLYIVFVLFFFLHVGVSYSTIMLPGFYLFVVDRYLRFLQSRRKVRLISTRVLPCDTVELNFAKTPGLIYNPTSIMFMNVPSISKLQWHPFTITSSSNLEPEILSVFIKTEGVWTSKLYNMLSSPSSLDRLEVSIEGPYGPSSTHFLRHDSLVMVSGGSGITPFISIIRDLIFACETRKCKTPKVTLICAFKNSKELTMLDLILPLNPPETSNFELKIEAYVTREQKQPQTTDQSESLIRTKWFKPHTTDVPLAPILGPNGWLWLGAIISSSFVLFLVLMGIVNRFYIYPIDHNSKKSFPMASKVMLNVVVTCASIIAIASTAVFWNKKQYELDGRQIQNFEGATPTVSPNSWFYNADKELESLPHQSFVQATNINYGERPDLKKILFECKGSSVGVLVCGPKKMRHDVAMICSSGLADNLHFESISFSW